MGTPSTTPPDSTLPPGSPPPAAALQDAPPISPPGSPLPPAAAVVLGGKLNEQDAGDLARSRAENEELRARIASLEKQAAAPVQVHDNGDWFSQL